MNKRCCLVVFAGVMFALPAHAQNCTSGLTPLTDGTIADAVPVMANFNYLGGCAAPLSGASFTGQVSTSVTSTQGSGTFYGFNITGSQSGASTGTYDGLSVSPDYTATSGTLTALRGIYAQPANTNTGAVTNLYGIQANPWNTSGGTVTTMYGVVSEPQSTSAATGAINTMYGIYSKTEVNGAAAIGTMEPLYANCANSGGSVGTCYELYLDTPTGTIPPTYGVYQKYASATNYFAGKIGIGTTMPAQTLEVNGEVQVDTFASASSTAVCENGGVLSSCSSSIRYKEDVKDASFGLDDVMKMRPVTFKWKGRDENDIGLVAEEVAKINPLFATYKDGKVEGVKYAQLTAVLVNAIKELKSANDAQAAEIARLQTRMSALERKDGIQAALNDRSLRHAAYVTGTH